MSASISPHKIPIFSDIYRPNEIALIFHICACTHEFFDISLDLILMQFRFTFILHRNLHAALIVQATVEYKSVGSMFSILFCFVLFSIVHVKFLENIPSGGWKKMVYRHGEMWERCYANKMLTKLVENCQVFESMDLLHQALQVCGSCAGKIPAKSDFIDKCLVNIAE